MTDTGRRPAVRRSGSTKLPVAPGPGGPRWSRWIGRFLARVVWDTAVVGAERVPRDGGVLLAGNHMAYVDGLLLHGVAPRPTHMMVKEEAFAGAAGAVLRAAGQIPVDGEGGRSALAAALAVLRRGEAVGIFPEGARGRGDAMKAHAGAAWLAVTSGVPVVPVAVLGTRLTGESIHSMPKLRRKFLIEFGEPFVVPRPPGVSGRAAVAHANEVLRHALAEHVQAVSARTGIPLPEDEGL